MVVPDRPQPIRKVGAQPVGTGIGQRPMTRKQRVAKRERQLGCLALVDLPLWFRFTLESEVT